MTPKQKKFCEYYIQSGNATDAARKAGYSAKTADRIGPENLGKPVILQYISEIVSGQDKQRVADATEVLEFYSAVMRGKIKDQFGLEASLADRIKAGDSLMKRYNAGQQKTDGRNNLLDAIKGTAEIDTDDLPEVK